MALPSPPSAVGQTPAPEGGGQTGGSGPDHRNQWWRLRPWNRDVAALVRLRDGLKAIPDDPPDWASATATEQARPSEPAGQAAAQPAELAAAPPVVDAPAQRPESAEPAQPVPQPPPAEPATQSPQRTPPAEPVRSAEPPGQTRPAQAPAQTPPAEPARPAQPEAAGSPAPNPAVAAIRETFAFVANAGDKAVAHFFAWLFVRHPELRDLFPAAMTEQRERLFQALVRIVDSLTTPDELATYLAQLGRDHRKYAVEPWMYAPVGEALLTTVRAFSGSAFTRPPEEAWTQAYSAASAL